MIVLENLRVVPKLTILLIWWKIVMHTVQQVAWLSKSLSYFPQIPLKILIERNEVRGWVHLNTPILLSLSQTLFDTHLTLIDNFKIEGPPHPGMLSTASLRTYWLSSPKYLVVFIIWDANQLIKESSLDGKDKEMEIAAVLNARKEAFGDELKYYPPFIYIYTFT